MSSTYSGWLKKRSPAIHQQLQSRFFALCPTTSSLRYYASEKEYLGKKDPRGAIPLGAVQAVRVKGATLEVDVGYRVYSMDADDASAASAWKSAIESCRGADGKAAAPIHISATTASPKKAPAATAATGGGAALLDVSNADAHDASSGSGGGGGGGGGGSSSNAAGRGRMANPGGLRLGVIMEGSLLKAPPEWSVRRVAKETRLQQRWFVLSNRALRWYSDATMSHPLSSLPLDLVTKCEPKAAESRHPGKFYLSSSGGHRTLKLVAPDAEAMMEWVDAINGARAVLDELRDSESTLADSQRRSTIGDHGRPSSASAHHAAAAASMAPPEAVRLYRAAAAQGEGALAELAHRVAGRLAEEFGAVLGALPDAVDVDSVIEVGDRCAELMCGELDEVHAFESGATLQARLDRANHPELASATASPAGGGHGEIFLFFLHKYHANIFAHLGGFFLDAEALSPHDALALLCWVEGYHSQLGRIGVDASSLAPSLADAADDLASCSVESFGRRLEGLSDDDAFAPRLPIVATASGKASMSRSSAHAAHLELPAHGELLTYLQEASEGLPSPALTDLLARLLPRVHSALEGSVHPRLFAWCDASRGADAAEALSTSLNSACALHAELTCLTLTADPPLGPDALAPLTELRRALEAVISGCASRTVTHILDTPGVQAALAPVRLLVGLVGASGGAGGGGGAKAEDSAAAASPGGSLGGGGHDGVHALIGAASQELRRLGAGTVAPVAAAIEREVRTTAMRAYIRTLLVGSTHKFAPATAVLGLSNDAAAFGAWCEETPPVANAPASAAEAASNSGWLAAAAVISPMCEPSAVGAAELAALDDLRRLLKAEADAFAAVWTALLERHPDTPMAVADAVLTRRGELSKHKKSLLATCSQAHNAKQAEATAEWAVGRRSVRPGTSENVFAAALSRTPTRAKGAMAGLMSRLNKA